MRFRIAVILVALTALTGLLAQAPKQSGTSAMSIVGYLRDAGCVYRFRQVVKPLPNGCLQACVRAGSPLVILTRDEQVYQPISPDIPDKDIRPTLLPFVGQLVKVTGPVYQRGDSKAIAVEQIEQVKP